MHGDICAYLFPHQYINKDGYVRFVIIHINGVQLGKLFPPGINVGSDDRYNILIIYIVGKSIPFLPKQFLNPAGEFLLAVTDRSYPLWVSASAHHSTNSRSRCRTKVRPTGWLAARSQRIWCMGFVRLAQGLKGGGRAAGCLSQSR